MSDDIIDLDALVPQAVTVHLNGQDIKLNPPKTVDLFRLGALGTKLQDAEKFSDEEMIASVNALTEQVKKCMPELPDVELNTAQLMKLVEIITSMTTPPEAKELEKRGITTGDPKAQ